MADRFNDFQFVSTGDAEQDAKLAADIRRRLAHEAEGLCANGCGPMEELRPGAARCPACGFVHYRRTLSA